MHIKTNLIKPIMWNILTWKVYVFRWNSDKISFINWMIVNDIIHAWEKILRMQSIQDRSKNMFYDWYIETNRLLLNDWKEPEDFKDFTNKIKEWKETDYIERAFDNIKDKVYVSIFDKNDVAMNEFFSFINNWIEQWEKFFIIENPDKFINFKKPIEMDEVILLRKLIMLAEEKDITFILWVRYFMKYKDGLFNYKPYMLLNTNAFKIDRKNLFIEKKNIYIPF